jgi:hypothetical protein
MTYSVKGKRKLSIKLQLLLESKRTVNSVLQQILELEIVKLAVGSSIRLWETSDIGTLEESVPCKIKDEINDSLRASATRALANFESFIIIRQEKEDWRQHDVEVPFMKVFT